MDDSTKILVALGASAAANCRPCMDQHLGRAHTAELAESDIRVALEVGSNVNKGAQAKTLDYIRGLTEADAAPVEAKAGSCC
jgi:AhpD family alkylhydroperoxidase